MENAIKKKLRSFIVSFLMPTLIGKSFVIYFGLNYSSYPGEGYGYGLIVSIVVTVVMLIHFAIKFSKDEDLNS